jgi:hypothetical protein
VYLAAIKSLHCGVKGAGRKPSTLYIEHLFLSIAREGEKGSNREGEWWKENGIDKKKCCWDWWKSTARLALKRSAIREFPACHHLSKWDRPRAWHDGLIPYLYSKKS